MGMTFDYRDPTTAGCRVYSHHGNLIVGVRNVEFDGGERKGTATVCFLPRDEQGRFLIHADGKSFAESVTRIWCEVVADGDEPTTHFPVMPSANADGVIWVEGHTLEAKG